jgi:hypothetical protein
MARAAAKFRWRIHNDIMLFWADGGVFAGADFDWWYELVSKAPIRGYVGGAGTNFDLETKDRLRANVLLKERQIRFAVVVESRAMSIFIAASRWMGVEIAAFSLAKTPQALSFVGVSDESEMKALQEILLELKREVEADLRRPRETNNP